MSESYARRVWLLSGKLERLLLAEKEATVANDRKALVTSHEEDGAVVPYQEVLSLAEIRTRIAAIEAALAAAAGR